MSIIETEQENHDCVYWYKLVYSLDRTCAPARSIFGTCFATPSASDLKKQLKSIVQLPAQACILLFNLNATELSISDEINILNSICFQFDDIAKNYSSLYSA